MTAGRAAAFPFWSTGLSQRPRAQTLQGLVAPAGRCASHAHPRGRAAPHAGPHTRFGKKQLHVGFKHTCEKQSSGDQGSMLQARRRRRPSGDRGGRPPVAPRVQLNLRVCQALQVIELVPMGLRRPGRKTLTDARLGRSRAHCGQD